MELYAAFKAQSTINFSNMKNFKLGEETEFTVYVDPKDFANETFTIDADIGIYNSETKTYDPITYDENNYIKVFVNNEWKEFKDISITLNENKEENAIKFKILLTDKVASDSPFYIPYTFKQNGKATFNSKGGSYRALAQEDIVAEFNGGYYGVTQLSTLTFRIGEIKLAQDVTLEKPLAFTSSDLIINLNGNTIDAIDGQTPILVNGEGANITIKNGKLVAKGGYAAIQVGKDSTKLYNTHLTIENDVQITGENYAISVFGKGTVLDFKGKIEVSGNEAYGISGNATRQGQYTVVNVHEGATITANNGFAFYLPQNGELNVLGGNLTANTVIGVKSGKINVSGGTLTATGEKVAPTQNGNGINVTGDVIYAEVNDAYEKNIEINVTGGTLTSTNGNIIQAFKSNSIDDITVNGYSATVDESNSNIITYN